jgi:hypothetical protein
MRKVKLSMPLLFGAILLCICLLHACNDKETCHTCTATKDGAPSRSSTFCTTAEQDAWEALQEADDYDVNCD